jgi:hypothetical protein
LLLAGVVAGLAVSLLLSPDTRTAGATLLGAVVVAVGTFRTIQVTREGQITERFTRAIEQLGSKEDDVRLGAIYALERIAGDSQRDHGPIMEVLTAYIRKRAPWPPSDEKGPKTQNDVQAVLAVIGRREVSYDKYDLDLRSTDLRGAKFGEAKLKGVNLEGAHLEDAHLNGADFRGAHLKGTHLRGAIYGADTKWPAGYKPEEQGAHPVADRDGE